MEGDLPPLDIKLTGPFYVQQHPMTDDICVYDASNRIVEAFFHPQQAQAYCDELNGEYELIAKPPKLHYRCRKCGYDVYWTVVEAASSHESEPFLPCTHFWKEFEFVPEEDSNQLE